MLSMLERISWCWWWWACDQVPAEKQQKGDVKTSLYLHNESHRYISVELTFVSQNFRRRNQSEKSEFLWVPFTGSNIVEIINTSRE